MQASTVHSEQSTHSGFDAAQKAREADELAGRIDRFAHDCRSQASPEQRVVIMPIPLDRLREAERLVREFADVLRDVGGGQA